MVPEVSKYEFFKKFEIPSLKDDLKLSAADIDLVGCLLPLCERVSAGPSTTRFLVRPIEHLQIAHSHTLAESKGISVSVKKNAKAQTNLNREVLIVT